MRRLLLLVAVFLLIVPRAHAQWRDTTYADGNHPGHMFTIWAATSQDSVYASAYKTWIHPGVIFMCDDQQPELLSAVWLGIPPAPNISDSVPIFIRVFYRLDQQPATQAVWRGSNEKVALFIPNAGNTEFMEYLMGGTHFELSWAMSNGQFSVVEVIVGGLKEEWKKIAPHCPKVKLSK